MTTLQVSGELFPTAAFQLFLQSPLATLQQLIKQLPLRFVAELLRVQYGLFLRGELIRRGLQFEQRLLVLVGPLLTATTPEHIGQSIHRRLQLGDLRLQVVAIPVQDARCMSQRLQLRLRLRQLSPRFGQLLLRLGQLLPRFGQLLLRRLMLLKQRGVLGTQRSVLGAKLFQQLLKIFNREWIVGVVHDVGIIPTCTKSQPQNSNQKRKTQRQPMMVGAALKRRREYDHQARS